MFAKLESGSQSHGVARTLIAAAVLLAFGLLTSAAQSDAFGQSAQPDTGPDVHLGRPAEGETFYSGPDSLLYSLPINGWAFSDSYPPEELEVRLEVIQAHSVLSSQTTHPNPDGSFLFKAEVNSGNTLASFEIAFQGCADKCHDLSAQQLPVGTFLLRVTATDPGGAQASDQRQVTVDRAAIVEVPVRLVLEEAPAGVPAELPAGIQVNAGTLLYLWRNRGALSTSEAGGLASVPVEALSQAPTHYTFEVQPQVVAGVRYRGLETVEITLLPGQSEIPALTLPVEAQAGQISGQLDAPAGTLAGEVPVWAFELPAGQGYQLQGSPTFHSNPLPIGRYIVAADLGDLASRGCRGEGREVDLAADPQAQVQLAVDCAAGAGLQGTIQGEDHHGLPFARITVERGQDAAGVTPNSGAFWLPGQGAQELTLIAAAPGHYSQARRVSPASEEKLTFSLVRRPETTSLAWGQGEVIVPAESQFTRQDGRLELTSGWVWGRGGAAEPLVIDAGGARLSIASGRFALAVQPDRQSWFYLFTGQAEAQRPGQPAVSFAGGQMLLLSSAGVLTPVDYQPTLVQALNPSAVNHDFTPVWQPTPGALLRDRLARLSLSTAQVLTFLVYTLALVSLIVGPLLGLYVLLRRRGRDRRASQ